MNSSKRPFGSTQVEKTILDFPFYKDNQLTVLKAVFLLLASVCSMVLFIYLQKMGCNSSLVAFTNVVIPLAALFSCVKWEWIQLFRKIGLRDIFTILITIIFLRAASIIIGLIQVSLGMVKLSDKNPLVFVIETNTNGQNLLLLLQTIAELTGEELITIIPFLSLLFIFFKSGKITRKKAILLSWIITAVLFGAFHLSTYNWNIYQAVIGIGIIRLILTYAYIKTKNLWVSMIVHIANDWIIFLPIVISNWK